MENEILKWAATAFITLSALQVSLKIQWSSAWWAYIGFVIGHVCWAIAAIIMKEWALLVLNGSFIFLDLYAIYIRYNPQHK